MALIINYQDAGQASGINHDIMGIGLVPNKTATASLTLAQETAFLAAQGRKLAVAMVSDPVLGCTGTPLLP